MPANLENSVVKCKSKPQWAFTIHILEWLLSTTLAYQVKVLERMQSCWNSHTFISSCKMVNQFSSAAQSCFNSQQPHGLQHARLPCPLPTPRACSNSCSSSRWCHPTISSSVVPFSSCLKSFPASGSFPMGHFFTSGGQNTRWREHLMQRWAQ